MARDSEEKAAITDVFENDQFETASLDRDSFGNLVDDETIEITGATSAALLESEKIDEGLEFHNERDRYARLQDDSRQSQVTTNLSDWKSEPDRFDYPGVDTPDDFEL
jgi:hypothetical protein